MSKAPPAARGEARPGRLERFQTKPNQANAAGPAQPSPAPLSLRRLGRTHVAKRQIGRRIVALNRQRARGEPLSLARILVGRPRVGPIAHRIATHPGGHVIAGHYQSQREPGKIVGHHAASILPTIESAHAAILGLGAIAAFEAVLNLAFVSLPELAWNAAEE